MTLSLSLSGICNVLGYITYQDKRNAGGNGLFHSFALWFILRKIRPSVIVESGVFKVFSLILQIMNQS